MAFSIGWRSSLNSNTSTSEIIRLILEASAKELPVSAFCSLSHASSNSISSSLDNRLYLFFVSVDIIIVILYKRKNIE